MAGPFTALYLQNAGGVNVRRSSYTLYIGRGRCRRTKRFTGWANPASHKKGTRALVEVATPEEALAYFERKILASPAVIARIRREMPNQTLGCFCKYKGDELCHGDIYVKVLRREPPFAFEVPNLPPLSSFGEFPFPVPACERAHEPLVLAPVRTISPPRRVKPIDRNYCLFELG